MHTIPNLSLKGLDKSPALVVAPMSVNGGRFILILRLLPSLPIIMSKEKSSMAGYNISSIYLGILCISSINNTSLGSRVESIAAKSPLFSIVGPLAVLILLPSSLAIMDASVVFPKPGGPYNKT